MKKLLLVIFLFSITNLSFISYFPNKEKKQTAIFYIETSTPLLKPIRGHIIPMVKFFNSNDTTYIKVLNSIKQFEGLRLESYTCPANQRTIGYGHCIKNTDNFGDTITLMQAENLLMQDFNHAVAFVKEHVKGLSIENNDVKILALAHFAFNVGVGTFENSSIVDSIKNNIPINEVLLKYIHYRNKNKQLVKSKYLKQIRQYEIDLFNSVS